MSLLSKGVEPEDVLEQRVSLSRKRDEGDKDGDVGLLRHDGVSPAQHQFPIFKRSKLATDNDIILSPDCKENEATSKSTTLQIPLFLSSHSRILRALYETKYSNSSTGVGAANDMKAPSSLSLDDDVIVDKDVWAMMESFLEHRNRMNDKKINAKHAAEVYYEHETFWEKEDVEGGIGSGIIVDSTTNNRMTALPIAHQRPHRHNGTSPGAAGGGGRIMGDVDIASTTTTNRSIHLVSCLLQHKSSLQQQQMEQHTAPFLPLLQEVERRIDTLRVMMRDQETLQLQQERATALQLLTLPEGCTHRGVFQDENEWGSTVTAPSPSKVEAIQENISVMESKLRLWQRLESDLRSTVEST